MARGLTTGLIRAILSIVLVYTNPLYKVKYIMNIPDTSPENSSCIRSAADILGTKWTALIIRELGDRPKRYCEIERRINDINPRILCQRLEMLHVHDIVTLSDSVYELTAKGRDLIPILDDMAAWSAKYPRDPNWNVA